MHNYSGWIFSKSQDYFTLVKMLLMEHMLSYDTKTNKAFLLLMKRVLTQKSEALWIQASRVYPHTELSEGPPLQTDLFLEEKKFKI